MTAVASSEPGSGTYPRVRPGASSATKTPLPMVVPELLDGTPDDVMRTTLCDEARRISQRADAARLRNDYALNRTRAWMQNRGLSAG